MNKVVVLVLADIDTKEDLGRVVNALQTVKEFKEGGDQVRLVFDGAGTRWIGELGAADHKYHALFASVKDRAGACSYCAKAFGVKSPSNSMPSHSSMNSTVIQACEMPSRTGTR